MSSSRDSSEPRSPASTEACIDEVVETTATAIERHLGDDARATLVMTERRHISHEPRLDSDPEIDTDTERLPVMTVKELARASAKMELETPSSLSAFEVPGRRLWPRGNVYEQATRKVPEREEAEELAEDEIPELRSSTAPWLFAAMALVVGLASSAAYFMHANMADETRSPAVAAPPPPPTIDEHVPPTPVVAPPRASSAIVPAASASAVVPRRRR